MSQRHVPNDAEPGTGTQYHFEALANPLDHPDFGPDLERPEDELAVTQYRAFGRVWQCRGDYWDRELQDLVTLDAVVRKSSWCDTHDAKDGALKFQFYADHHGEIEYDPNTALQDRDRLDPTERFLPRHNVPHTLP